MHELMIAAAGFAAGLAVSTAAARLRHLAAQRDAWGHNWRAECRRHDATLRSQRQMQQREALAVANIMQLSHALRDAAAQVAQGRGGLQIGGNLLSRFSRN